MLRARILRAAFGLAAAMMLLLAGRTARADLKVVATVPTLAALAKDIGGEHVDVSSLSLHTQDPHFVDAKPSLALTLNKADMLLAVGLGLEVGWLPTLQTSARNARIHTGSEGFLDCSQFARVVGKERVVDRSKGDIHPGGNPHYLYDPRQLEHVAIGVAARMSKLDHANSEAYARSLKVFLKGLHKLRHKLARRMKPHRGVAVIAYHDSWTYLTTWLGLSSVALLEPKPGIPPNPSHVAKTLVRARQHKVRLIIQESYYPNATAKLLADKSGAKLLVLPGAADFRSGESVLSFVERLVSSIDAALR